MELEARMFKAYAKGDEKIQLKIIPGHFVTSQSHISHYLDMTTMKTRCAEASRIARLLSSRYETSTPVDSIICMDGLEVIGAFLAEELAKAGVLSMNAHKTIYIVTPEFNSNGQMIFRDKAVLYREYLQSSVRLLKWQVWISILYFISRIFRTMSHIRRSNAQCAREKKKSMRSLMGMAIRNCKHLKCPYHLRGKCAILIAWAEISAQAIIA